MVSEAPDRTVSTAGQDRPAPCNPRSGFEGEGAIQGDVSRPKQSGGRVTATEKKMIARGRLSPTKEVTGGCWAHLIPDTRPGPGASEQSEVAPGPGNKRKDRRAAAVTAKRVSAVGPELKICVCADERIVRRTRSRPWKSPRPGSRSEATSAGTGQNRGDFSRRAAPVAAKRSSGAAAQRRRGSPFGADGSGC